MLGWKLSWKVVLLFNTLRLKNILSLPRTRRQCRLTCCTFRNKNPVQSTDSIDFSGASNIPTKDDLRNSKYSWERGIFYTGETNNNKACMSVLPMAFSWHFKFQLSLDSVHCESLLISTGDKWESKIHACHRTSWQQGFFRNKIFILLAVFCVF